MGFSAPATAAGQVDGHGLGLFAGERGGVGAVPLPESVTEHSCKGIGMDQWRH
jgi:hypothetical protein